MTVLNTTFLIDNAIIDDALRWICRSYVPAATKASGMSANPRLMRVLGHNEPGTGSYALHLEFQSKEQAAKFDNGVGASLRTLMHKRFGEKMLAFSTCLGSVDMQKYM